MLDDALPTGHHTLPDGRRMDVRITGPEDGQVLLFLSGTPFGATRFGFLERAAHERGLRVVAPSRAGYGDSSRLEGRDVVDVVADAGAILDQLGVTDAVVAGWSGGGPHALACAARLPQARAAACITGVAPFTTMAHWTAGMGEGNVQSFSAVEGGPEVLRAQIEGERDALVGVTVEEMVEELSSILPPVDRAYVTDEFGADFLRSVQESFRVGIGGWIDDSVAVCRGWGFALDEIDVPVSVWHGSDDLMTPISHGRMLAEAMPQARAHLLEGEGHISILVGRIGEILDELVAGARAH